MKVPYWNMYGRVSGEQYAIIYQAVEELEIEVLT
jgi:hypothetical protein